LHHAQAHFHGRAGKGRRLGGGGELLFKIVQEGAAAEPYDHHAFHECPNLHVLINRDAVKAIIVATINDKFPLPLPTWKGCIRNLNDNPADLTARSGRSENC